MTFVGDQIKIDKYALLPSYWHGMTPDEKKKVLATVAQHGSYTPECCIALRDNCYIPLKDFQNIRVCIGCAREDPLQLNMGIPESSDIEEAKTNADGVVV